MFPVNQFTQDQINNIITQRRFSVVPSEFPDINTYPLFYQAKKVEVILNEGEYLFIPAGWFHFVFSEKIDDDPNNNLNVAMSHFIVSKFDCIICDLNENKNYTFNCPEFEEGTVSKNLFKSFRNASQPFKVNNFKKNNHWNCFNWTEDTLLQKYEDTELLVNSSVSPFFVSNYIEDIYPKHWIEKSMSFKNFIDTKGHKYGFYYYLLQTGKELKDGSNDIKSLSILENEIEKNYAIWINFSNVFTALHFDESDNILLQIKGRKRILLYPPSERKYLYTVTTLSNSDICKIANN